MAQVRPCHSVWLCSPLPKAPVSSSSATSLGTELSRPDGSGMAPSYAYPTCVQQVICCRRKVSLSLALADWAPFHRISLSPHLQGLCSCCRETGAEAGMRCEWAYHVTAAAWRKPEACTHQAQY